MHPRLGDTGANKAGTETVLGPFPAVATADAREQVVLAHLYLTATLHALADRQTGRWSLRLARAMHPTRPRVGSIASLSHACTATSLPCAW